LLLLIDDSSVLTARRRFLIADRSSLTGPRTQVSGHEFTHAAPD